MQPNIYIIKYISVSKPQLILRYLIFIKFTCNLRARSSMKHGFAMKQFRKHFTVISQEFVKWKHNYILLAYSSFPEQVEQMNQHLGEVTAAASVTHTRAWVDIHPANDSSQFDVLKSPYGTAITRALIDVGRTSIRLAINLTDSNRRIIDTKR